MFPTLEAELDALLHAAGTPELSATLRRHDITSVAVLAKVSVSDFATMGITIGARIKLTAALRDRRPPASPHPPSASRMLPSTTTSDAKRSASKMIACLESLPASSPLHRDSALSRLPYQGWAWPTLWLSPGASGRVRYLAIPKAGSTTV